MNPTRATRFRIWGTGTLEDHLIRRYTLNDRRLREQGLAEAEQAIDPFSRTLTRPNPLSERREATPLFGQERGEQLAGIPGSIEQTFDGQPLCVSVEEKAAHLLCFVSRDYPFADGDKSIGSFLFILFLRENGNLEDAGGQLTINDNALAALALLVAESEPRNRYRMIRLVMKLLVEGLA